LLVFLYPPFGLRRTVPTHFFPLDLTFAWKAEFRDVLHNVIGVGTGFTEEQFDKAFAAVDRDGKGKLDLDR
jgi:hypothetical protein